jgi:hypothetical protein
MLQALEHMLDTVHRTSILAGQRVNAQKTGKPLSPPTLKHYEEQLEALSHQPSQGGARKRFSTRSVRDAN